MWSAWLPSCLGQTWRIWATSATTTSCLWTWHRSPTPTWTRAPPSTPSSIKRKFKSLTRFALERIGFLIPDLLLTYKVLHKLAQLQILHLSNISLQMFIFIQIRFMARRHFNRPVLKILWLKYFYHILTMETCSFICDSQRFVFYFIFIFKFHNQASADDYKLQITNYQWPLAWIPIDSELGAWYKPFFSWYSCLSNQNSAPPIFILL